MCGGASWDDEGWQPFPALSAELVAAARLAADADMPLGRETAELSIFPGVPLS
jgi:hypothetical protein